MSLTAMHLMRGLRNGIILLCKGEWRELVIRLRIALGHVDLKHDPTQAISERTHYYADSGGLAFDKILANFEITPNDAIVDFGCGKGGILISLSKYPFSKITGVEISPELVEIAKNNIKKLRIKNVEVECCDASQFKKLNEYNYFYFFDPFPCVVMNEVMINIENSIIDNPRKIIIIYLNPFCHELIESRRIFTKTSEISHFEHKCFIYSNAVTNQSAGSGLIK